ncbi:MAG: alpha/beta hydrolase [Balneolaceae bacterium]|nr:alpha/beta hydrolase [Balneolaceae bacterium]
MTKNDSRLGSILTYVTLFLLLYVGFGAFAFFFADSLIFQPPPPSYPNGSNIITLNTSDNEQIAAVYLQHPDAEFTILFSHGNAEDIGLLMPLLKEIQEMGFSVLAYDYRGYGQSTGKASEANSYEDINTAYHYLVNEQGIKPQNIIAHGRSLGGALAIDLASQKTVGGLIVESSFITAYRVMTNIPIYPFDQYRNLSKIDQVECPVLFIHGKKDRVIPFWHGKALFDAANEPKEKLWVDNAGHNDLYYTASNKYRKAITDFLPLLKNNK